MDSATEVARALELGRGAIRTGRPREAIALCEQLLATDPNHAAALALLGVALSKTGDIEAAIDKLERAVALNGKVAGWHANLSALNRAICRTNQAVAAGEAAVRLNPKSSAHLVGLALAWIDKDERHKATVCLLRALGLAPNDASAHLALGQILLAQGEMQAGWREYEWRDKTESGLRGAPPRLTSPLWNGMRLAGRLLLIGDQGYGDAIQFARYAPLVAERCQEVVLACGPGLAPLLSRMPGVASWHRTWNDVPRHAAHIGLSSLPYLFGTELATIPSPAPYLFADPARVAVWRERLGSATEPRVGLAWRGRPDHPNDRRRSLRLPALLPLSRVPGIRFVSLQKPVSDTNAEAMRDFPGLTDLSDALTDFGETAALIANLDLVITIDTAVAHLAGAMGRPAWVMLARPSDWRWLLDRGDSPWYPSLRLFRQAAPGAWDGVIAEVAAALVGHVETGQARLDRRA